MIGSQPSTESVLLLLEVPTGSTARYDKLLRLRSAGRERLWQLRSQKGRGACELVYMLALTDLEPRFVASDNRQANDPTTEVWRACQRSGSADGGQGCFVLLIDVGLVSILLLTIREREYP